MTRRRRALNRPAIEMWRRGLATTSAIKDIADALRQHRHLEWLRNHLHTGIEMAVADHCVFRIAGDENHLQIRSALARRVRDLATVEATGKSDVGNQKVYSDVRLQD